MNSEQILLDNWRYLTPEKQSEVLDFMEFLRHKHNREREVKLIQPHMSNSERVKQWIDWAESHPKNSPGLPDVALSRDSIYD
ncbi:hypothetical protein [Merismopedia glauca]|uniref:DUF2281 domain-containing protein n=1 Tax=Merismopedia glauca CCAP 1448/3 TaxID=1296344 RepID=A0A2T1BY30_9CYAN|nr:hypothetical protein [Merismopedia glauca]PSB00911.1 hypothetical protein C7B64_21075 [Merismopedia glauca CCAP 1448/3]